MNSVKEVDIMSRKIYKEINLNDKLFGENFIVYDWVESDEEIHIYVKTKKKITLCKDCGSETIRLHNTYNRTIQILPIRMKTTYVHVKAYKYKCMNANCDTKVIMENLSFASPSQVKSDDLICTILGISAFLSNEGASKVLKHLGIKASNDTIKRLCDNIIIEDNVDIEAIGVDDVAIRKGQTYATAIYDMNDHHLIALLDGRDGMTFKEWLKGHTKITKITRDRASNLASAINEVLPNCIQIADRFHLLQNLLEYLKDILKTEIPKEIIIQEGKIMDNPIKELGPDKNLQKVIDSLNYDNTPPVDENGIIITFDTTMADKSSKQYQKQAENRKKNSS
jgi:transposase